MDAILKAKQLKNEASALCDILFGEMFYGESEQSKRTQRILHRAQTRYERRVELYANAKWPQRIQGPK